MKKVLLVALVASFGVTAFAQDTPKTDVAQNTPTIAAAPDRPKLEVAIDYSYLRAPQDSFVPSMAFNGAGASLSYFFTKHIGLRAEFQDYGSFGLNISVPASTQGCNSLSDCQFPAHGSVFTYTAGPVVRFYVKRRYEPFAEVLFGGAHNNIYADIYNHCAAQGECINLSKLPNNNAFDFTIGGGLDIPLKEHISIRPGQVDFVHTGFGNSLVTGKSSQSNLRLQAAIVLRF